MVLLGVQFVITLVVVLFLQKLGPYYSLARWIMNNKLFRYLHPTNDQLKALAGKPNGAPKGKRKKASEKAEIPLLQTETFTVPCNIDVPLELVPVEECDLYSQYKYQDYKWLVDFSFCATLVYILIELAALWRPQIYTEEFNIGFVWCLLVVYFALKELFLLTAAYWGTEDGGERAMTISFGFFFFILAMGILLVDESVLDFGLEVGYTDFADNLQTVFKKLSLSVQRAPSIWTIKIFLALLSASLGAVLGFPGIRYANMQLDSIFYFSESRFNQLLLHATFFSPFFLILLWILPLSNDLMYVKKEKSGVQQLMTYDTFLYARIHLFILVCLLRLFVVRRLLQSHLNSAYQKIAKLKKETGRISNLELQRTVARVFYYLSAAALQYVAPLILMLFFSLMLRTLTYNMVEPTSARNITLTEKAAGEQKKEYAKLIRSLFSVKMVNGVCSYLTWWTCVSYFLTSCFGTAYLKFLA